MGELRTIDLTMSLSSDRYSRLDSFIGGEFDLACDVKPFLNCFVWVVSYYILVGLGNC